MKKDKELKNTSAHHPQAEDINDALVMALRDVSHTMRFLYEGKGSQKRVLMLLLKAGSSLTQRELTERLGIKPGSASEVIAKLEAAAFIERTPNKADGRTADIHLTGAGKAAALEAAERRLQRHKEMFSCLDEAEKERLLSLLEKVNGDWETRYREAHEAHRHCPHGHKKHPHRRKSHRLAED